MVDKITLSISLSFSWSVTLGLHQGYRPADSPNCDGDDELWPASFAPIRGQRRSKGHGRTKILCDGLDCVIASLLGRMFGKGLKAFSTQAVQAAVRMCSFPAAAMLPAEQLPAHIVLQKSLANV
jgi:hypothetical protein